MSHNSSIESRERFILKNVKAVDQNKFEKDVINKVDKAYKKHVLEERSTLQSNLKDTSDRIKVLSKSIQELNECLIYNLKTNNSSLEEFNKIKNSLQNQLDIKNQELSKLNRIEKKCKDQLSALDVSEKFNNILNESTQKRKRKSEKNQIEQPETSTKQDDDYHSDGSAESTNTMIFDPSQEQMECIEPVVKRRKIIFSADQVKPKIERLKTEKLTDDADLSEFAARIKECEQVMSETVSNDQPVDLGQGVSISSEIWTKLFGYQQIGVRWLLKLHWDGVGGILGDEMGLGKTVQVIAFLSALQRFEPTECGPVLIVCPATVMRQWVDEFRCWAPLFRVALLHATGSGYSKPAKLLQSIANEPGVLVTTYSSMVQHHALLIKHAWQYVILDEGHKIKNPNAKVTLCVKQFETSHRLIMSGSPIQNNLKELWSIVDFVYPGKLGSMATFMQNFALPIMKGGYENASPVQVETAYRCACVIRDTINAYLLRRTKAEVELQLPRKTEQVLFCGLTYHQQVVYREYLASRQCRLILSGEQVPFPGLIMLRKICNHPDLVTGGPRCVQDHPVLGFGRDETCDGNASRFGHFSRSGKMVVVKDLLRHWFRGRHKVLLFTQARTMLEILKRFLDEQHYPYSAMDGTTSIAARHSIVTRFNETPYDEQFVFLLTTRVGGLGLNLVGADRVLVFDPDWNPCTDLQARERAWRIGQQRDVIIYRLVISGSVEEKIYHRQVFKQFLTNRILKNPRQRRFFKSQDLQDLFRLDSNGVSSDTSLMFRGTGHHRRVGSGDNFFDDASRLVQINGIDQWADDDDIIPSDLSQFDAGPQETQPPTPPCVSSQILSTPCINSVPSPPDNATSDMTLLTDQELKRLRRKARQLSKALTRKQKWPTGESPPSSRATRVEGALISNVDSNKETQAQVDTSDRVASIAGDHIVSAIGPAAKRDISTMSYRDICQAERVANQARQSLDATLAGAGVTDCFRHDAIIDDVTPDWALVKRETDSAARSGISWLRTHLMPVVTGRSSVHRNVPKFGAVRNSFLCDKHEQLIYFQSLESLSTSHFTGTALQTPITLINQRHARFSSPIMLTIIKNRCSKDRSTGDSVIISDKVKNLTKNLYLFLAGPTCRGQTSSDDLIARFRHEVSANNNLLFKTIVNELCTFQRGTSGGLWILKNEFVNNK